MHRSSLHNSQSIKNTYNHHRYSNKRRPSGFRVIMKNRSNGLNINDNQSSVDDKSINLTKTQSSLNTFTPLKPESQADMEQTKQQLKMFAKSMNPNRIIISQTTKEGDRKVSMANNSQGNFNKRDMQSVRSGENQKSRRDSIRSFDIALPNPVQTNSIKIQDLQKRLDALIQIKLVKAQGSIKLGHKSKLRKTHCKDQTDEELNNELQSIIQTLMKIEEEDGNDYSALDSINRKILLLEKAMAESLTESQMIKKYYYSKTTNRKVDAKKIYSSHRTMNLTTQQLSKKLRATSRSGNNFVASVSNQSICKSNYKAPKKEDYVRRSPKPEYLSNNQPLPRSSYDRDFLTYGNLPKFSYKQQSSNIMPIGSKTVDKSSYRNDFTTKQQQRINFKELDCFKDKLKNLKVSFMNDSRKIKTEQSQPQSPAPKPKLPETKIRTVSQRIKTTQPNFIKNLKSQNGFNYQGEKPTIKSLIKHKNLHDLKYTYKASLHT